MKQRCSIFLVLSLLTGSASFFIGSASAQVANDATTQNAILAALPAGMSAEQATVDDIAQAATTLAFTMKGNLEANITQVMVSLGELTKAGKFKNAPRYGDNNPTGRFYTKIMNMASSNLDVASKTYYSLTVQDMTRLAAAAHNGMDFLNGAKHTPITRK